MPVRALALDAAVPPADQAFFAKLDGYRDEILRQSPEAATQLGFDHGDLAFLKGELSHQTGAALEQVAADTRTMREDLAKPIAKACLLPGGFAMTVLIIPSPARWKARALPIAAEQWQALQAAWVAMWSASRTGRSTAFPISWCHRMV
jgi:hypothetical protein